MKVVIDTNIFISSFFNKKGNPRKIINLWKEEKIQLCISSEILEEYLEVLSRLGLAGEPELKGLLNLFKKQVNI
ncbi:MAG: putative toxin-antitoxin system toxin component, PIN family, partial [Actinobacteria bacterium]|nr:putative toxin-antitoxin system toxin component, PIN family [Actinomycetota bacterium]